ncbi:FAD dependent oxidoreductase, partial [Oryctes borbonicus]
MADDKDEIIIVGGGLVGSLCSVFLAKRGFTVHLYEKRDIRKNILDTGRSINLALSNRGRKALRLVGLEEDVLMHTVPMEGRYVHVLSGKNYFLPYDAVHKQNLYSVNRNRLNALLITG